LESFLLNRKECFLRKQHSFVKQVFCTWGEDGAGTVTIDEHAMVITTTSHLPENGRVVDTVGAGDVFIGVILGSESNETVSQASLEEAVEICGRKVCQEGFSNLVYKANISNA
jgi:sugar/nucleoside kinase (ribokinase family)